MKNFLYFFTIFTISTTAAPYVEWKHQDAFRNLGDSLKTTDHLRLGYKTSKNYYFEMGHRTDGISAEMGYKFRPTPNLTIKGKVESNKVDYWKHKIETEVRYTFKK
jgi:hypothetical protein